MTSLAEKGIHAFLRAHNAIYQRTNGWIGHRLPGAPDALLLHTVGAKTGKARTTHSAMRATATTTSSWRRRLATPGRRAGITT